MPDRATAWSLILSELESDIDRLVSGGALVDGAAAPARWSPPAVVPPLPDEYAHAARKLIDRQLAAIEALEEARRRTGEHLAAVRAAEPARGHQAAYLDVEG